jgi:hypothetical protein
MAHDEPGGEMNDHELVREALLFAEQRNARMEGAPEAFERINRPVVHVEWDPPLEFPAHYERTLHVDFVVCEVRYSETNRVIGSWHDPDGFVRPEWAEDLERRHKGLVLHEFGRRVGLWPDPL